MTVEIKKEMDVTYQNCYIYEFHYFFNRKDSGSIFIAFNQELDEFDQDGCIEAAVAVGALDTSYAENIDYVEQIDSWDAREMNIVPETVYSI